MVEAMGTVPTLRQLGMQLRDAGMRWRVQELQSRATERERLMRTGAGAGTGTGSTQTLTIYGRLPSLANVVPGSYTDTVTVTVSY